MRYLMALGSAGRWILRQYFLFLAACTILLWTSLLIGLAVYVLGL